MVHSSARIDGGSLSPYDPERLASFDPLEPSELKSLYFAPAGLETKTSAVN